MTVVADRFGRPDRRASAAAARWSGSLLLVLALHAALLLFVLSHRVGIEPVGVPPAAVILDLPPLPEPPPESPPIPIPEPIALPPPLPEPEPPPPIPEVELPPPIPVPPPAVTLPAPQPKPRPKPAEKLRAVPREPLPVSPAATAPSVAAAPPAVAPIAASPAARITWQGQVMAWLNRHKRYPRIAQDQRQQGTVGLRFAIDRGGHVLAFQIVQSSGHPALDEEVLALIQRAQPLPAPPAEVPGARIDLQVPVEFSLRR